jgi:hypothetical protein
MHGLSVFRAVAMIVFFSTLDMYKREGGMDHFRSSSWYCHFAALVNGNTGSDSDFALVIAGSNFMTAILHSTSKSCVDNHCLHHHIPLLEPCTMRV